MLLKNKHSKDKTSSFPTIVFSGQFFSLGKYQLTILIEQPGLYMSFPTLWHRARSGFPSANFLMWKESFSISFRHLKLLLGFWPCCTDIMSSGIWACQCFHSEKTNECKSVLTSLHPQEHHGRQYIPSWNILVPWSGDIQARLKFTELQKNCSRAPAYFLSVPFISFPLLSPSLLLLD